MVNTMDAQLQFGVLISYNDIRGFGFIRQVASDKSSKTWFFHVSKLAPDSPPPQHGALCHFTEGAAIAGKLPHALTVQIGAVIPKYAAKFHASRTEKAAQ